MLTTHHIDEAEQLADSIAILARGHLLACGTPSEIKKTFGVGFHLLAVFQTAAQAHAAREDAWQTVTRLSPTAKLDQQSASNILKYTVPSADRKSLPSLFEELSKIPQARVSVQASTLEDAFVNIGNDEQAFLCRLQGYEEFRPEPMPELEVPAEFYQHTPSLSCWGQVRTLLKGKFNVTRRSPTAILGHLYALIYITLGVVLVLNIYGDSEPRDYQAMQAILFNFIAIGYIFNSNIYVSSVVRVNEKQIRYGLTVMGLRPLHFWAA